MDKYHFLLGEKIKKIRKSKNITQEQLAELVNRSKNHISKIEQGTANPPISLLFAIANVLSIDPYQMFLFNENIHIVKSINYKKELHEIEDKSLLKKLYYISQIIK